MLNFDSTVNIATILALVAIVCPVLTAIIDNVFRLIFKCIENKQKRYEQDILHKREIFENFLSSFNEVCQRREYETLSRYASSYSLIYIYLPQSIRDELGKVNELISQRNWDAAIKYVDPISADIYNIMQKQQLTR